MLHLKVRLMHRFLLKVFNTPRVYKYIISVPDSAQTAAVASDSRDGEQTWHESTQI